jgi:hypothetical protein
MADIPVSKGDKMLYGKRYSALVVADDGRSPTLLVAPIHHHRGYVA